MEIVIKQLKQNNKPFVPQTTAEAVLVKHDNQVQRLDTVLSVKLETIITPAGSGLTTIPNGTSTVLLHSNEIESNSKVQPLMVRYDNRGHIVETAPMGKLAVVVNDRSYIEHDGSSDQVLSMGDDFTIDEDNKIKLNWNNL